MQIKKILLIFLIFLLISNSIIYFIPNKFSNISLATTYADHVLTSDIAGIDDSIYPGYKSLIQNMQAKHSNYTFLVYYTGLEWGEVLNAEYQGHFNSPLNLVQVNDNYNGQWICPICGTKNYDNGKYCCASLQALAYMMDPRNSINDTDIFQFKDLNGSDVTADDIRRVVANYGSYLNNEEAIQAIVEASNTYNINGYFLVSTIVNEQGKNGSTLSLGQGYNGKYVGVYNYFNIGAYGNSSAAIITNGLSKAQSNGWTSIRASILGGAQICKESYITRYSQNTMYYQKFNVSGVSDLATHQYQQNILAAESKGISLKSYYSNLNSGNYVFIIPLYKHITSTTINRPSTTKVNSISYENGSIQNVTTSLTMRLSPSGTAFASLNNGESVKIIQRATSQVNGYYWDLIVSTKTGNYGYAARIVKNDTLIVGNGQKETSSGSTSSVDNYSQDANTTNPNTNNTSSNTSYQDETQVTETVNLDSDVIIKDDTLYVTPIIGGNDLLSKFKDAVIKNQDGNTVTDVIGTGYTVTIDNKEYKIIKLGDSNGDSNTNILDVVKMLNGLLSDDNGLKDEYYKAACIKGNSTYDITDIVLILNYLKGTALLNIK